MAVVQSSAFRYTGLSGDTKPTIGTTPVGTQFVETDTGAVFEANGVAWVEVSPKTRT